MLRYLLRRIAFGRLRVNHGFSLVELSIVLVILGLLVGGILSGQSLIRASEMRTITEDYARYHASVYTFRDRYFSLPGDMINATQFWGIAGGTTGSDTNCTSTASTDQKTCNGNGDRKITGEGVYGGDMRFEIYRFWQHLANAGLIAGQYSGVTGPHQNVRDSVPGVNTPTTRISSTGFDIWYNDPQDTSSGTLYPGSYNNSIIFGGVDYWDISIDPALKASEAWNIDTKLDDGKPASGMMRVLKRGLNGNTCATTTDTTTALYSLNDDSIQCTLVYSTGF